MFYVYILPTFDVHFVRGRIWLCNIYLVPDLAHSHIMGMQHSCWVALRPTVLTAARIWPSVFRQLEISSGLRDGGLRLGFNPFRWGYCLAPDAPLIRGMPTGPKVFLTMLGACGLRPCARTHLKKGLAPHLTVRRGEQQIPHARFTHRPLDTLTLSSRLLEFRQFD